MKLGHIILTEQSMLALKGRHARCLPHFANSAHLGTLAVANESPPARSLWQHCVSERPWIATTSCSTKSHLTGFPGITVSSAMSLHKAYMFICRRSVKQASTAHLAKMPILEGAISPKESCVGSCIQLNKCPWFAVCVRGAQPDFVVDLDLLPFAAFGLLMSLSVKGPAWSQPAAAGCDCHKIALMQMNAEIL